MADLTPLEVRAHLVTGLAHATPWGITLDGLLAAEIWAEHKVAAIDAGEDAPSLAVDEPIDLDLPLARCTLAGSDWHWQATCSYPQDRNEHPHTTYWATRADHRGLEQLSSDLPGTISERQGRYRSRYMPVFLTLTRTLVWRVVGDLEAIREIVSGIDVIGKKRAHGQGQVQRWDIAAVDADEWDCGHLHPDNSLGRPAPIECFTDRPLPANADLGRAALRPPHMHPARMRSLYVPSAPG